jgi:hypothetical protein
MMNDEEETDRFAVLLYRHKPRVGVTPARLLENKGRGRKQTKDPQSPLRSIPLPGYAEYYLFGFGRYGKSALGSGW